MLKYTSVFYDLMMRSWPYTCVDQWSGFVHSVHKYTSVHSRTPPYIYIYIYKVLKFIVLSSLEIADSIRCKT
ncbi:hypothetical protein Hanom_Chr17g01534331 [Helianthus anomalus]